MDSANWCLVVLPYVEGTSERIPRVMRKHQVPLAMRPVKTLKSLLVHPNDKQEKEDITYCVYNIPKAVHIRKEGRQSLNRDEGSYTLSHMYNRFRATSYHYRGKNWKRN